MERRVPSDGIGPVAHMSFSGDFGGREKVAASLCRSMRELGHACFLYMVVEERAGRERNAHLMESLGDLGECGRFFRTGSRFSPRLLAQLAAHLGRDGVRLLHCHCYKSLYYAVLLRVLGRFDGRIVYTLHGLVMGGGLMASLIKRSQQACLHRADGVIGCSREVLESTFPNPGKVKTTSIINAIEPPEPNLATLESGKAQARRDLIERYRLDPEGLVAINVGRICPQKNYPLYLSLIQRELAENPDMKTNFPIVGNGELQAEMEAMAESLGIRLRVCFTGFVSDMDGVYRGADMLIQTSTWEGTPMCLLEARSHALPVVAPAVGGNPDVVNDGVDGFLYDVGELGTLSTYVGKYLGDDELRHVHGHGAFMDTARRFNTKKWIEEHVLFYAGLQGHGQ